MYRIVFNKKWIKNKPYFVQRETWGPWKLFKKWTTVKSYIEASGIECPAYRTKTFKTHQEAKEFVIGKQNKNIQVVELCP